MTVQASPADRADWGRAVRYKNRAAAAFRRYMAERSAVQRCYRAVQQAREKLYSRKSNRPAMIFRSLYNMA